MCCTGGTGTVADAIIGWEQLTWRDDDVGVMACCILLLSVLLCNVVFCGVSWCLFVAFRGVSWRFVSFRVLMYLVVSCGVLLRLLLS